MEIKEIVDHFKISEDLIPNFEEFLMNLTKEAFIEGVKEGGKSVAENDNLKLAVFVDEDGKPYFKIKNDNSAIIAIVESIESGLQEHDKRGLDILFSCVVHLLAREPSGKFENEFIENIKKTTFKYRKAAKEWKKFQN